MPGARRQRPLTPSRTRPSRPRRQRSALSTGAPQITEHPKHGVDDASFASDWKAICRSIEDQGASPVIDGKRIMVEALDCASFEPPKGKGPWTIHLEFRGGGGALVSSGKGYVYPAKDGLLFLSHADSKKTNDATCPNTPPDCICKADGTNDTTTYYDLRTGARLLEIVQLVGAKTPIVKAKVAAGKLEISGGACDRTIDLAGLQAMTVGIVDQLENTRDDRTS